MTEEVTKTARRPKATPKAEQPAPEAPEPTAYAAVFYNHKPSNGDLQTIIPRLLEALAPQLKGADLADAALIVSTKKGEDGNWQVLVTA